MKILIGILLTLFAALSLHAEETLNGWRTTSPRAELRPQFESTPANGLLIRHDQREGLDGWFEKSFEIHGGQHYHFQVRRKTVLVNNQRQSCLVRIRWQDNKGDMVSIDQRPKHSDHKLPMPSAEPEYPADGFTDNAGWTTVSGIYRAPAKATKAIIELHLQWAPGGQVEWQDVQFKPTGQPHARRLKLAAVHVQPTGQSPSSNCQEMERPIAEAAKQGAHLVVLGETIPNANIKAKPEETAEAIPGPSTIYFASLAKQHKVHLVFSLLEREQHLIYNTAVLLGPDGELIGKYRKVSLPPGEAASGIAPGKDYPVFDTSLGRVAMMVCYDGFFPEVARELTKNGAEIIAWPVWGCNPLLAQARACENHVYVVSSTFMAHGSDWMISAVFDPHGTPIATAKTWGSVAIAEVDLSQPYLGPYNLGDFRAMIPRHRPLVTGQP